MLWHQLLRRVVFLPKICASYCFEEIMFGSSMCCLFFFRFISRCCFFSSWTQEYWSGLSSFNRLHMQKFRRVVVRTISRLDCKIPNGIIKRKMENLFYWPFIVSQWTNSNGNHLNNQKNRSHISCRRPNWNDAIKEMIVRVVMRTPLSSSPKIQWSNQMITYSDIDWNDTQSSFSWYQHHLLAHKSRIIPNVSINAIR